MPKKKKQHKVISILSKNSIDHVNNDPNLSENAKSIWHLISRYSNDTKMKTFNKQDKIKMKQILVEMNKIDAEEEAFYNGLF